MQSSTIEEQFLLLPKSKIKAGEGINNGKYPFFTSSDIKISSLNSFEYDEEALILGTGGKASCNYINGKFSFSTDNYALKTKGNIETKFLYYYLRSNNLAVLQNGFHGAGLQHIGKDYILNISFPLYEKSKQVSIINSLDTINKIIMFQQRQLNLFDKLIKSRFVEMFGDPEVNPYNWKKVALSEIITTINNGMTRRGSDSDGNVVLRLVELQEGFIDYSNVNRIKLKEIEKTKFLLKENDFLFARVNGNPNYVGRCAIFLEKDEPIYHNDHIIRVHCKDNIFKGIFGAYLFNSDYGKLQIKQYISTSAGQFTINQTGIGSIIVILPPVELQNEFEEFVKQINKLKFVVHSRYFLCEILTLFSSTIAYSRVVSILACPNIFCTCSIGIPLSMAFVANVLLNL